MRESAANELYLKGRVQVETALGALAHAGINPGAQKLLQSLLDAHSVLSDGNNQNDLSIYIEGGGSEGERNAIVASLDNLIDSEFASRDKRMAATALRKIMLGIDSIS